MLSFLQFVLKFYTGSSELENSKKKDGWIKTTGRTDTLLKVTKQDRDRRDCLPYQKCFMSDKEAGVDATTSRRCLTGFTMR